MSFLIKNEEVGEQYEQIWDAIKNKLGIKLHIKPIYENKYLKTKAREHDGAIKTNFLGNGISKINMHYTWVACITIDSVIRMNKKNYPQVYLEECKYKVKKIQMTRFTNTELDSDSEWDSQPDDHQLKSDSHNDSDNGSDNDSDNDSHK